MLNIWRDVLTRIVGLILACLVVGWLMDAIVVTMLIGAFGLLIWHYYNFYQVAEWLWHNRRLMPPQSHGSWGIVLDGIYRLQKNNRRRRSDLAGLIKRFRQGAEAIPDATVVFTQDYSIVWCNKLAQQVLGLEWPKDAGQRLSNLIRTPDFIKYLNARDFSDPFDIVSPHNEKVILEIRVMPYVDSQLLLMARDVSKIKQLQNMRQDFVANVSHELRTPLTVLQGYLEVMENIESMPPEMLRKARDMMHEQTVRMSALTEQLLTMSRIESQAENVFDHVIDVKELFGVIESEAYSLNSEKKHRLIFDIDPQTTMYGIQQEMRSAFSNLIFNAIHYTPDGGVIEVKWQATEKGAEFSVTDNGDGIAFEHLARLTERFYRVDKARSRQTGGSGLGLSIVKHVLSRHYSSLDIASKLKEGSCFSFVIPKSMMP